MLIYGIIILHNKLAKAKSKGVISVAKQHTSIILRKTSLIEVSLSLYYKDEDDIERKDIKLLKQHSNNITGIRQKDDIVTIEIWFDSREKMDEFVNEMDKLTK